MDASRMDHLTIMLPLPKGITGFDAPAEGVTVKHFTTACHHAARLLNGRVHQVLPAGEKEPSSFHTALITLRDQSQMIRILCNAQHPLIAFATPAAYEGDVHLEFIDCPELAAALRPEFSILTRQESLADITPESIALLGKNELHELRYWEPQCLGEVVFNFWD